MKTLGILLRDSGNMGTVNTVSYYPEHGLGEDGYGVVGDDMDYEAAARKLIVYSQGLAKGSLGTARSLAVGEAPVLQYLSDKGEPMNPSVLADTLGYTRPRMTRILDSLVYKGYVERRNDENDRRKVLVSATPEGIEHAKRQGDNSIAAVAEQLQSLGDSSARELVNVLEKAYSITYDREPFEKPKKRKKPLER